MKVLPPAEARRDADPMPPLSPKLTIHGGAGNLSRSAISAGDLALYRLGLKEAVAAGGLVLESGGSAIDAVCAGVTALEDNPIFNAGRGAVYTHEATHELDACVMDGSSRSVGAVACVKHIRNPVLAARAVMHESERVLLVGEGADAFARTHGLAVVDSAYFDTERRREELDRALHLNANALSEDAALPPDRKFGTVGAVALDCKGHLAAATSTGGMTNKTPGRVGDSPIAGAGTYASDDTWAVSCTGHGEFFIRAQAAGDVAARMRYLGISLEKAAHALIEDLAQFGGRGGLVAVDATGAVTFAINTAGMYRAVKYANMPAQGAVFTSEELTEL